MSGDYKYLSSKIVAAKKQHQCGLCALPIHVGELHHAQRQIWEGQAMTFRSHTPCYEITKSWGEDEWEYQDVMEFRKELARFEKARNETEATCK